MHYLQFNKNCSPSHHNLFLIKNSMVCYVGYDWISVTSRYLVTKYPIIALKAKSPEKVLIKTTISTNHKEA